MVSGEVARILNFFLNAPEWVQRETEQYGEIVRTVKKIAKVPNRSGIYWMHGSVILRLENKVDAVFVVDSDAGGKLLQSYWHVGNVWYAQEDPELPAALGLGREEMFPYDYMFTVPLERDSFHT